MFRPKRARENEKLEYSGSCDDVMLVWVGLNPEKKPTVDRWRSNKFGYCLEALSELGLADTTIASERCPEGCYTWEEEYFETLVRVLDGYGTGILSTRVVRIMEKSPGVINAAGLTSIPFHRILHQVTLHKEKFPETKTIPVFIMITVVKMVNSVAEGHANFVTIYFDFKEEEDTNTFRITYYDPWGNTYDDLYLFDNVTDTIDDSTLHGNALIHSASMHYVLKSMKSNIMSVQNAVIEGKTYISKSFKKFEFNARKRVYDRTDLKQGIQSKEINQGYKRMSFMTASKRISEAIANKSDGYCSVFCLIMICLICVFPERDTEALSDDIFAVLNDAAYRGIKSTREPPLSDETMKLYRTLYTGLRGLARVVSLTIAKRAERELGKRVFCCEAGSVNQRRQITFEEIEDEIVADQTAV